MMKLPLKKLFRFKGGRAGNSMLEFALGSSLFLASFAGTFEFGYTFYQYNTLQTAVSDGARYASLQPYDSSTTSPSSSFLAKVQNMVVYGNPSGGTAPIAPNLATSNVNLTVTFTNSAPSAITVYISGYAIDAIFATTTLSTKPKVTYPYVGVYSPY